MFFELPIDVLIESLFLTFFSKNHEERDAIPGYESNAS